MDALIRAARVGPTRTRLKTLAVQPAAPGHRDEGDAAQARLREEIEERVRGEMALQMQAVLDTERERARTDGYADGLAQARSAAELLLQQDRKALSARTDEALSALSRAHQIALTEFESAVGEVSFAAICRLVGREAASQSFTLGLVEQVSLPLRNDAIATVRLHPRDIDTIEELLRDESLTVRALGLRVIADESLEFGGCVVESNAGDYDGGLEGQLRRLHAALTGADDTAPVPSDGPTLDEAES